MANISRRHVLAGLGTAGFASSLGTMTNLGLNNAWAADTGGYKAIVCIFLIVLKKLAFGRLDI